ncbi:MAG: histidine utilization repressor [Gammaproteobacteria bacterium]
MTSLPLHERIRRDIERRVLSGQWPPGHRIPIEQVLMAKYDCSRMTVNKAIAALVQAGLIERRRRAGSFVAQPPVHSAVLHIPDIQVEIESRGDVYGYELLSRRKRTGRAGSRQFVPLAAAGSVLELRCLHRASGQVFALEERLINLSSVPDAIEADFSSTAPGSWLLAHVPWTEAEHKLSAINPDPETASLLGIATARACLSLERLTWRGRDSITSVRQTFPGHLYDLAARFSPRKG